MDISSNNIMDISNNIIEHLVQNIFTDLLNEGQTMFSHPQSNRNTYVEYMNNNNNNNNNNNTDNTDNIGPPPALYSLFHHIYHQRGSNNIVNTSLYEKPAYKQVADDSVLEELVIQKFEETEKKNTGCPIYFTEFENDDEVIELPCKHLFTPDGIKKWLTEESNECPVCRYSLTSKEIKNEDEIDTGNARPAVQYHNPMQRYLIERILQTNNNNNNNNEDATDDDEEIEFQQALMNSMNTDNC